jgi:hypothetical protein
MDRVIGYLLLLVFGNQLLPKGVSGFLELAYFVVPGDIERC